MKSFVLSISCLCSEYTSSGNMMLQTANAGTTGVSGYLVISTGQTTNGISGSAYMGTGSSSGGNRCALNL